MPLFNGRNLDGWVNVNCAPDTWSVRDGMIHSTGKPICELRTARMFENFILELEYQHLEPQGNAGVFIWGDALTAPWPAVRRGRSKCRSSTAATPRTTPATATSSPSTAPA